MINKEIYLGKKYFKIELTNNFYGGIGEHRFFGLYKDLNGLSVFNLYLPGNWTFFLTYGNKENK